MMGLSSRSEIVIHLGVIAGWRVRCGVSEVDRALRCTMGEDGGGAASNRQERLVSLPPHHTNAEQGDICWRHSADSCGLPQSFRADGSEFLHGFKAQSVD